MNSTTCSETAVYLYIGWARVYEDPDDPMWLHVANTCGHSGLINRLAKVADDVVRAAARENLYARAKGVFQYEVVEPLGMWIATRSSFCHAYSDEGPIMPDIADVVGEMRKLVAASVVKWELAEHAQGGAR